MAKNFEKKPLNQAIKALLLASAFGLSLPSSQVFAQEENSASENDQQEEELIVLGIRRSLKNSMDIKRNSSQIVDAISAEDIGKLPDVNIAESLKRVTGVQIGTRNGMGSTVRIRGMANVNVLLNGSPYTGSGNVGGLRAPVSRNITLEDIPSDLVSGIDVIKSTSADMSIGGLTGSVDFKTKRPLDIDDYFIGGSAKNTYSDVAEESTQKYLVYLGKNWDDKFGVILQVNDEDTLVRNDSINYQNWDAITFLGANPDDLSQSTYLTTTDNSGRTALVVAPQEIMLEQASVVQDKLATNFSMQFRPTEELEFYVDAFYTEYEETISRNQLEFGLFDIDTQSGNSINDFTSLSFGQYTNGTNENVDLVDGEITLLSGGFEIPSAATGGNAHVQSGNVGFRDVTNSNIKIGGSWQGESIKVSSSFYRGSSSFDSVWLSQGLKGSYGNINCAWRDPRPLDPYSGEAVECVENLRFGYDLSDGENGNVFIDPTLSGVNPQGGGDYLTDPYSYAVGFTGLFVSQFETRDDTFTLDVDWDIDKAGISQIEFGVRSASRENSSENGRGVGEHFRAQCTDGREQLNPEGCANLGAPYTDLRIGQEDANSLYVQPEDRANIAAINDGSFMRGVDGSENFSIRQWISGNPEMFSDDPLQNVFDVWGMFPMSDKAIDQTVTEDVNAIYLKANLDFDDLNITGNAGIRFVDIDISATSYTVRDGAPSQVLFDDIYLQSDYQSIKTETGYSETLPSLNLNWAFHDQWVARFAASRAIALPDLQDLPGGARVTDVNSLQGRIGNPDLEPWKVNQADVSVEWYFSEDDIGMLSAALFYKDFSSFITSEGNIEFDCRARGVATTCSGTRSINGEGEVSGLEIGYTQPLPYGFGVQANYTYLDSEDANGLPIPGNSENTYNFAAFYEDFGVGVRLAYSWQDTALNTASGFGGKAEYTRDRGQLDLAINYDITDSVSVTLAGTNLTQEGEASYSEIEERLIRVQQFDRTAVFSIRGKF